MLCSDGALMSQADSSASRFARQREDEARWAEWMGRALEGDREAYARLMQELGAAIERFLCARFGFRRGSDWLEDCVQESLLAIHQVRHTYDPRRPFRPWLFTIVRHKTIDLLRRQRVRSAVVPGDVAGASVSAASVSAPYESATLLALLAPEYREALVLTKFEGLSIREAAARAGTTQAAMKTRVHRAIRAIQARLRADEEGRS